MPIILKEIYSYFDAEANLLSLLQDGQRGISTDGDSLSGREWLYKLQGGDSVKVSPNEYYTDSSGLWSFMNVEWNDITSQNSITNSLQDEGGIMSGSIPITEVGEAALNGGFTATSWLGALNELKDDFASGGSSKWNFVTGPPLSYVQPSVGADYIHVNQGLLSNQNPDDPLPVASITNTTLDAGFTDPSIIGSLNQLFTSIGTAGNPQSLFFSGDPKLTALAGEITSKYKFNFNIGTLTETVNTTNYNVKLDTPSWHLSNYGFPTEQSTQLVLAGKTGSETFWIGGHSADATITTVDTIELRASNAIWIDNGAGVRVNLFSLTGGGSGPANPDESIQFNNGGVFGGDSDFVYDATGKIMTLTSGNNGIIFEPSNDGKPTITLSDNSATSTMVLQANDLGDGIIQYNSANDLLISNAGAGTARINGTEVINTGLGNNALFDDGTYKTVSGGGSQFDFDYQFQTNTSEPPSNQRIRYNDSDVTLVTEIYVDDETSGGTIVLPILKLFGPGDDIFLFNASNVGEVHKFVIVSTTDVGPGDYIRYVVTHEANTVGLWSNNQSLIMSLQENAVGALPGGNDNAIQFNNTNTFGGDDRFIYDNGTNVFEMNDGSANLIQLHPELVVPLIHISDGTDSLNLSGVVFQTITTGNYQFENIGAGYNLYDGFNDVHITGWHQSSTLTVASITEFNITSGKALFIDRSTDAVDKDLSIVPSQGPIPANFGLGGREIHILINSSGDILQQATVTASDLYTKVYVGNLTKNGAGTEISFETNQAPTTEIAATARTFLFIIGGIQIVNMFIGGSGLASLQIARTAGEVIRLGIETATDRNEPDNLPVAAESPIATLQYRYIDENGDLNFFSTVSALDPSTWYDKTGASLETVGINKWSGQRVYYFAASAGGTATTMVLLGQAEFNSEELCANAMGGPEEDWIKNQALNRAVFLGWNIVRGGATNADIIADVQYLAFTDPFELSGNSGGTTGGGVQTFQSIYNASTIPQAVTDNVRNEIVFQQGSGADTDLVFAVRNGAGITTFSIDGKGQTYIGSRLGIGNFTPAVEIDVLGSLNAQIRVRGTDQVQMNIESTDVGSTPQLVLKNDAQQWNLKLDGSDDSFRLRNITGVTEPLVIRTTGSFETSGPQVIMTQSAGGSDSNLVLKGSGAANGGAIIGRNSSDAAGPIFFYNHVTLAMKISSNGKITVNNASENEQFNINGNLEVSSTATAEIHVVAPNTNESCLLLDNDTDDRGWIVSGKSSDSDKFVIDRRIGAGRASAIEIDNLFNHAYIAKELKLTTDATDSNVNFKLKGSGATKGGAIIGLNNADAAGPLEFYYGATKRATFSSTILFEAPAISITNGPYITNLLDSTPSGPRDFRYRFSTTVGVPSTNGLQFNTTDIPNAVHLYVDHDPLDKAGSMQTWLEEVASGSVCYIYDINRANDQWLSFTINSIVLAHANYTQFGITVTNQQGVDWNNNTVVELHISDFGSGGGGGGTLLSLSDTPSEYNAPNRKDFVHVNSASSGVEFNMSQDILFFDNFDSGNFTAQNWITVNDTTNQWVVSSADKLPNMTNSFSAYISNNGGTTRTYSNLNRVSHVYQDIAIPDDIDGLEFSFAWSCEAEFGAGADEFDFCRLFYTTNLTVPVAGTLPSAGYTQFGSRTKYYDEGTHVATERRAFTPAEVSSLAGTTIRMVFSFITDTGIANAPAFGMNNVQMTAYKTIGGIQRQLITDVEARLQSNIAVTSGVFTKIGFNHTTRDCFDDWISPDTFIAPEYGEYTFTVALQCDGTFGSPLYLEIRFSNNVSNRIRQITYPDATGLFDTTVTGTVVMQKGEVADFWTFQTTGFAMTITAGQTSKIRIIGRRL